MNEIRQRVSYRVAVVGFLWIVVLCVVHRGEVLEDRCTLSSVRTNIYIYKTLYFAASAIVFV